MKHMTMMLCSLATLGLAACKEKTAADEASEKTAEVESSISAPAATDPAKEQEDAPQTSSKRNFTFRCGGTLVQFNLSGENKADMKITNVSYALKQVISASGAKYENLGDPETFLWNKGDKAMVNIKGQALPECTLASDDETSPPKPYRASGNEPSWKALLENATITLTTDNGKKSLGFSVTRDKTLDGTRTVTGSLGDEGIAMAIREEKCADSMSGEPFANTVTLIYGNRTYHGCGQSLIRNVTWKLEDMNNAGTIDDSHITLVFGEDRRMAGSAGCNNYTGRYTLEHETLGIDKNITYTMRACVEDGLMEQEQKFLKILPAINKAALDESGALILSGASGERLLFRAE